LIETPAYDRVKGKRLENENVKKPCIRDFVPVTSNVDSKTTLQAELLSKEIPLKKYQCKFCVHNYVDDDDLREHLMEEHQDRFKPIQLLEGGEKFYECFLCFKRTKMKAFHMKHLKTQHKEITLDLVKSVEQWKLKVISFMDFCIERDESFDYMLKPTTWESKPEQLEISSRLKLNSRLDNSTARSPETKHFEPIPVTEIDGVSPSIEIETLGDDSFDSLDCILEDDQKEDTPEIVMPEEIENNEADFIETVKIEPFVNMTSSPNVDVGIDVSSDEEVIEEYVSITKRRPPKVKLKVRAPIEFVCKVCDKMFPSGFKVSAHVFMFHLQRMSDMVWQELYIRHKDTNSLVCLLCGEAHERARLAKLHQYSEHKRELKKKMEEKGQDWRNLLDYIQYKVTEEMINEEDVTESEVESRSCSTSEVYNNPFYLATNLSDLMILQPDVTQTNQPSSPIPEVGLQEPPSLSPLPEPPLSESPLPVNSSIVHIKIAAVSRKVPVKTCGDESDSDDGVKVCMESRDVCLKKVEALSKGDKTQEEKKNEIIQPDSIFQKDMKCPFPKCNEMFLELSTLVDHYTASHPQSPLKLYLIRTLAPTRFYLSSSNKLSLILLGEEKMLFSCPQCEVQFTELQLQARHVARHSDSAVAQCEHCRNFVQVGDPLQQHQSVCLHRGELKRIGDLQSPENMSESNPSTSVVTSSVSLAEETSIVQLKLKPCTHRHGGCKEVFPGKKELHDHARKCKHRPNTSFACKHAGCTKRYYYKEDYDKHVARLHPNSAEVDPDPTPSTSFSEAVSTDTLPTCEEGSTGPSTP